MLWRDCFLVLLVADLIGGIAQVIQEAHRKIQNRVLRLLRHPGVRWRRFFDHLHNSG